jgi:hypothetical protein
MEIHGLMDDSSLNVDKQTHGRESFGTVDPRLNAPKVRGWS